MINTNFSPWPSYTDEEANIAKSIILSNKVNYWTGNECRKFEEEFAKFSDAKYAVAVANGTVALDLALRALEISVDDEVIVTSRSYLASVTSIVNAGAKPIFVDVSRESQNITASNIESAISLKTKAIVCVHLAGWPCDMKAIRSIAKREKLLIIEDCAQAHGAKYKGRSVGSFGDVGCWSFCQDKIISTAGEGGMVTTNDKKLWNKMWSYKDHGKSYDAVYKKKHPDGFRWLHETFGTNWRMTEIQGAIGRYQLKQMTEWNKTRNLYQNFIWKACSEIRGLRVPKFENENVHGAYKAYVFVENNELKKGWSRDKIMAEIIQKGVPCFSGSCSEIYLEKSFDKTGMRPKQRLPIAKELGETSLMFLIHPTLTINEIEKTCYAIMDVMKVAVR